MSGCLCWIMYFFLRRISKDNFGLGGGLVWPGNYERVSLKGGEAWPFHREKT